MDLFIGLYQFVGLIQTRVFQIVFADFDVGNAKESKFHRWLMAFQAGDRLGDLRRVERKKWDKAPSTNIQAPEKLQEPSFKTRALRVWSLKFGTSLVLGAWMLVLFAPPYSTVFVE